MPRITKRFVDSLKPEAQSQRTSRGSAWPVVVFHTFPFIRKLEMKGKGPLLQASPNRPSGRFSWLSLPSPAICESTRQR
jgi:hypothetical protein